MVSHMLVVALPDCSSEWSFQYTADWCSGENSTGYEASPTPNDGAWAAQGCNVGIYWLFVVAPSVHPTETFLTLILAWISSPLWSILIFCVSGLGYWKLSCTSLSLCQWMTWSNSRWISKNSRLSTIESSWHDCLWTGIHYKGSYHKTCSRING